MSAVVLPFRSRKALVSVPPVPCRRQGLAFVLQVRAGSVSLIADDVELELTPDLARGLALDLMELAREAEAPRG